MTIIDLDAVSKRLQALRSRLSIPQYEVAYEMGFKPRTYQSWEIGEAETSGKNYDKIAKYFSKRLGEEITRDQLLFGRDIPRPQQSEDAGSELHEAVARVRRDLEVYFGNQVDALRETLRVELLAELQLSDNSPTKKPTHHAA